ncbi:MULTISPECIES: TfoX/Sxy family protein [unclassified Leifsonia]|uniref:TfoX/Sxy family protein n=1 Tax=unclassified Leifsonia TaxID=2663824 RepID=UPI0008A75CEB|nr:MULTISPECIES: TfoX/Sxy family protein [unclassified Leifsonia]SEI12181.1 Transcriptional regulator of competence genes, TfoX/Sxy family [Leifsonia sp. CL154]SFL93949.1 Transcriptional regulator of competence genes, TfoX/Sxy family [Leifsonia sp. CL147]
MHIPRPSQETQELFRTLVPDAPGVQVKPMFANLGAFVNGNMFAGLFGDSIGVRLPDEAVRAELLAVEGAGPYGPAERPMGGYVSLPEEWKDDPDRLREWIGVALEQVGRMPPKEKKPRTAAPK